ncbi:hypothetical protein SAMN00120144_2809 [Hymenobacter roseosalivarius DSM 11622]|uniref:Uncharacterized protein n=1 Tax=Hymenobacter roseosalivarius DSM 11622 TaxID=645990 RepID=A0A1W1W2L6_9BACT|nr:hypothetical protein [Hymenobacter roseosalivarius]SMB99857.1 hypothetical protein SAMN00120144_2809 [Hymenobacter roseosalivarius DSM 11622]
MRTEAYQEEALEEDLALNASTPSKKLSVASKFRSKDITNAVPLATATRQPEAGPTKSTATAQLPATAPAGTADTVADSTFTTKSIAPKTVIAKDVIAIEERQNYAAQLPEELRQKGVEAKINVVGELADVIIMSSPTFDARSKDTIIKQVCIDLKTLGFKRVHITDGGDYTMHFGL